MFCDATGQSDTAYFPRRRSSAHIKILAFFSVRFINARTHITSSSYGLWVMRYGIVCECVRFVKRMWKWVRASINISILRSEGLKTRLCVCVRTGEGKPFVWRAYIKDNNSMCYLERVKRHDCGGGRAREHHHITSHLTHTHTSKTGFLCRFECDDIPVESVLSTHYASKCGLKG